MKKIITPLLLALTIGLAAYLDSPYSIIHKDFVLISDEALSVSVESEPIEEKLSLFPELENILVDKEEVDGYLVETYREYEIYKDKNGEVVKAVPTSNYDYIRYKIKQ